MLPWLRVLLIEYPTGQKTGYFRLTFSLCLSFNVDNKCPFCSTDEYGEKVQALVNSVQSTFFHNDPCNLFTLLLHFKTNNMIKSTFLFSFFWCALITQAQDSVQFIFHHQLDTTALTNNAEVEQFKQGLPDSHFFEITSYSLSSFCDSTASRDHNQKLAENRLLYINELIAIAAPLQSKTAHGEDYTYFKPKTNLLSDYRITIVTVYYQPVTKDHILQEPQPEPAVNVEIENHFSTVGQVDFESLEVGEHMVFPGLLFEGGRAVLLPESQILLDSIAVEFMLYKNIHFIIEGHICCHPNDGTDGENFDSGTLTLSLDRARTIYFELQNRGVDAERMQYTGLKASKPLGYEPYRDRRVEFKITQL